MDAERRTLGLAGDGDELGLLEDLERSFHVRFTDGLAIFTMGDLYDWIVAAFVTGVRKRNVDAPVRAYRMLLPILRASVGHERIPPSTRLSAILRPKDYEAAMRSLGSQGIRTPMAAMHWVPGTFCLAALASSFLGIALLFASVFFPQVKPLARYPFWGIPIFGFLCWAANRIAGPDISDKRFTVAWLARGIAALNCRRFSELPYEERDIWNAVARVAEEHAGSGPPIGRNTTIIDGATPP